METRIVNIPVSIFRELYCSNGEESCEYCSLLGRCSLFNEQIEYEHIEIYGKPIVVYVRCHSCRNGEVEQC